MPAKFDQLNLSPALLEVIASLGYQALTPIQELAIPPLMAGRDVIAQSKTGSGKTAAFGIPMLEKIETNGRILQALVLCPTRELCAQVARELRKLGRCRKDLQVLTLSGGVPASLDLRSLEHGAQIIVATPGRLLDHLTKRRSLDLSTVRFVVLDEADRMLDMGFCDKIEEILKAVPTSRQTALFSATYPGTIEGLAKRYMKSAERVTVEDVASETPDIDQICYRTTQEEKTPMLLRFLAQRRLGSVLVFCNFKAGVDELTEALKRAGHSADKLHGDLEQPNRERVMAKFRNGSTRVLVATDVAARGIDILGLDAVVNYDMPWDPAHYVHRIGRTGRAGAKGLALALVTANETAKLKSVEDYTGTKLVPTAPPYAPDEASPKSPSAAAMDTLSISGGRKEKLRPGDILGALTGDAGIAGDQVGKIEILDHVAFVAISRPCFHQALERLRQGKIKGRKFMVQRVC